jgi:flagellar motility protein MotE (MotC chaperone)
LKYLLEKLLKQLGGQNNKMRREMKHNVNIGLLILIIAILFCFSAAAIYYQTTFKRVSNEYKVKLSELQKVTSTLLEKKVELAETSAKKESLTEKYSDIKSVKETLEDENSNLKKQLDDKKNELIYAKEDLRIAEEDLENQKALADSYKKERDDMEDLKNSYRTDVSALCIIIDEQTSLPEPGEC